MGIKAVFVINDAPTMVKLRKVKGQRKFVITIKDKISEYVLEQEPKAIRYDAGIRLSDELHFKIEKIINQYFPNVKAFNKFSTKEDSIDDGLKAPIYKAKSKRSGFG